MGEGAQPGGENWLQELIAGGLCIGISKRELMEDYYMEEIGAIIEAWNALNSPDRRAGRTENVDAFTFLGDGGERVE